MKATKRRCPPLLAAEQHVHGFKALAHLSRLQVFFHIVRAQRELPAGEIRAALDIPGPTLSHHLDQLRQAGLLRRRRQERFIYYSVNPAVVTDLVRLLTACC